MTVDQMIEMLTELSEGGAGDLQVAVATQYEYPVSVDVEGLADGRVLDEAEGEDGYVWLTTTGHVRDVPYPSRELWDIAWREG